MNTIKFLQSSVYKLALQIFAKICGGQLKLQTANLQAASVSVSVRVSVSVGVSVSVRVVLVSEVRLSQVSPNEPRIN